MNQNKSLIREYIENVVNTGDTSQLEKYLTEDYTEIYDNVRYMIGNEGAREHIAGVHNTYSQLHLNIDYQIAEDDIVATGYTMTGVFSGSWLGIAPTNKLIRVTGINVDRIKNGKIFEHNGAANLLIPLLQTGAIISGGGK